MAVTNAALIVPSFYCVSRFNCSVKCQEDRKVSFLGFPSESGSGFCSSTFCSSSSCVGSHGKRTDIVIGKRRLNAVDTRTVENAQTKSTVEVPVTCYQVTNLFHSIVLLSLFPLLTRLLENCILGSLIFCSLPLLSAWQFCFSSF